MTLFEPNYFKPKKKKEKKKPKQNKTLKIRNNK